MKLRDLKKSGRPAWPPLWTGGAIRGTEFLATDPATDGTLVDVSADISRPGLAAAVDVSRGEAPVFVAVGVDVRARLDGYPEPVRGILEWDGPQPTPGQVATALQTQIGARLLALGGLDIGEATVPPA